MFLFQIKYIFKILDTFDGCLYAINQSMQTLVHVHQTIELKVNKEYHMTEHVGQANCLFSSWNKISLL